jgi:hypothetical protein
MTLRRSVPVGAALLALGLALGPVAHAQILASGTWTGTLTAGARTHDVTAAIERCATGFSVDLRVGGRTARTEAASYSRGRLAFDLPRLRLPGALVPRTLACRLAAQPDGRLAGTCTHGTTALRATLRPPTDAGIACDGT